MKNKLVVLVFGLLLQLTTFSYAQTLRWSKGEDLSFLEGEKTMKIIICYDSMTFDNGKKEMAYQEEVAKAYDSEKPGKGQIYLEKWKKAKEDVFTKYFLKDFKGSMKKMKIDIDENATGNKYIVKVYPLAVTPGAASFPGQRGAPSYTDFRVEFVEEANPKNVVGSVFIYQVMGTLVGYDLDQSFIGRFKNCFWFCGISLGREMIKIKKGKKR
jgi:hypothetical protein